MLVTKTDALTKLRHLDKRIKIVRGGTSAGKTICILAILIDYAIKNEGREISVVSESVPHLRRGALKDFLGILKGLNRYKESQYNRTTLKYTFTNGSYIEFFSTDQPARLRGARRTDLYMNECNNIPFEAYSQLAIRTSGTIWLDYNPSALFWVDKELIGQEDTDFITLTYKDNDALPESIVKDIEKAKEKAKTSTYWSNWWRVYGLGEVGSLEGACIPDWKEIDTIPNDARLLGYGMDFGYNDPTTIISLYKWNDAYIFDEVFYKSNTVLREVSLFLNQNNMVENIIADSAEPKSIETLRRDGHSIYPCTKGRDSVNFGINLINQNEIYVSSRSKNLKRGTF
jgi:phage terminase large subunit